MQPTFVSAFGLSKTDLPMLVAFHPKKLRGASLKGSYSSQSIDALLDGLFSGSIHSEAFLNLPALVEGGEDDVAGNCHSTGITSAPLRPDGPSACVQRWPLISKCWVSSRVV